MNDHTESKPLEAVPASLVDTISRAEFDVAIATAHRFPRSIKRFRDLSMTLATLDEDVAETCFYVLERGGKKIEGPSVRLAEIVASTYGNLRVAARVIEIGDKEVVAQGVAHDLESNYSVSREVRRRITNRDGRRYSEDMIAQTCNAACSIAMRNALFAAVPFALVKPVYEAAKKVAVGDAKTLNERRAKTIESLNKAGISNARIFHKLGVQGLEDINLEHMAELKGMWTAIKDGEMSIDEAFPDPKQEARNKKDAPKEQAGAA